MKKIYKYYYLVKIALHRHDRNVYEVILSWCPQDKLSLCSIFAKNGKWAEADKNLQRTLKRILLQILLRTY